MKFNLYIALILGFFSFSNASCASSEEKTTAKTENAEDTTKQNNDANAAVTTAEKAEIKAGTPEGTTQIKMKTSMGDVTLLLYDATPIHRDNFIKLVNEKFYEGILFHRIMKEFMVQGGDPESKGAPAGKALGSGGPGYTLEAEIKTGLYHKKGALSAARLGDQQNPEKRSSGSQFYIVTGKITPAAQLTSMSEQQNRQIEEQVIGTFIQNPANKKYADKYAELQKLYQTNIPANQEKATKDFDLLMAEIRPIALKGYQPFSYTEEQLKTYETIGGAPFLDNNYTVFGEVIEGLDVVEKMGVVPTLPGDRPVDDVKIISMEIVK